MKDPTKSSVISRYLAMAAVFLSTLIANITAAPPPGYTKIWEDNFDGPSLNTANWTVGLRDPATGHLVPGAKGAGQLNNDYAGYNTAEDVIVSNGILSLWNQKRTYAGTDPAGTFQYTTGWVMSMHKVKFNGSVVPKYLEFRAKFPSGPKVWPALWMAPESLGWPPEWDIWEYFGHRSDVGYDNMGLHLATGPDWTAVKWYSNWIGNFDATYDCEAWHTYGWEWKPNEAVWYIDGVVVHRLANTGGDWPNQDMYLLLNNGVRTPSPEENTVYPNALEIDYVQLYEAPPPAPLPSGTYQITALHSGKALKATGTAAGSLVKQYTYNPADSSMRWTVTALGGGEYSIVGVESNKPMSIAGSSTTNGASANIDNVTSHPKKSKAQRWKISGGPGSYTVVNVNSGKNLDIDSASTADAAQAIQWTANGGNNQQFSFTVP